MAAEWVFSIKQQILTSPLGEVIPPKKSRVYK